MKIRTKNKKKSDQLPREDQQFKVADLFFRQKKTASEIARILKISREAVYPALADLRDSHAIHYLPPIKTAAAEALAERFQLNKDVITVVETEGLHDSKSEHLAAIVADLALRLIKVVAKSKPGYIGLGLGPGRGTLDVAQQLGSLMKSDPLTPLLRLVTISSACPAKYPQYSSTAFLNLFPSSAVREQIGLFAEPLVSATDFQSLHTRPGVRDAFDAKSQVDVVISSMGDQHEHDLLRMLLQQADGGVEMLDRRHWVGNMMYRPYSMDGPIKEEGTEQRAVTLFELDDFVHMSNTKNKHVILLAKSCGLCGQSKATALYPLLKNKRLKVWSEIVMDLKTATDILHMPA